jgi:hypothetical protein
MFFVVCPSYQEAIQVVAMTVAVVMVVLATTVATGLLVVVAAEEEIVKIYTGLKQ